MIFEVFLANTIHQYFDSKFKKYNLIYFSKEATQRNISFYYRKEGFLVRIKYNYPNNYLDIDFFKETDLNKLIGADSISLEHIMKDKNPNYTPLDYISVMPSKIPLEESLRILSAWLIKYASTYLDRSEWKSWRDII